MWRRKKAKKYETRIGSHIRSLREEKELSIEELAERMNRTLQDEAGTGTGGIDASTVGQIELGEIDTPSAPVIAAFAVALDTSVDALEEKLGEGDEPGSGRFSEKEGRLKFLGSIEPRVTKQANGKFTMHDIPIFTLHERDGGKFDMHWMKKAIHKQKINRNKGFLPRLIIGHNDDDGVVEKPAVGALDGFYFNPADGWLYADYVDVPAGTVEEIKNGDWPGRSIECFPNDHEITALALLGGTPPFFRMPDIRYGADRKLSGPKLHYSLEGVSMFKNKKGKTKKAYVHEGDPEDADQRIEALVRRIVGEMLSGRMDAQDEHEDDERVDSMHEGEEHDDKKENAAMSAATQELSKKYKAVEAHASRLQSEVDELKTENERDRWVHKYTQLRVPASQMNIDEEVDFILELPESGRQKYFDKVTRHIPKPRGPQQVLDAQYIAVDADGDQAAIKAHYEDNKDKFPGDMMAAARDYRVRKANGTLGKTNGSAK